MNRNIKRISFSAILCLLVVAVYEMAYGLPYWPMTIDLNGRPMTAMRVAGNDMDARTFANDPGMIDGYSVLQQRVIDDPRLQEDLSGVLKSGFTYGGGQGAKCFEPGIAVRFGDGPSAVDAVICLDCGYVYFYRAGKPTVYTLSTAGKRRIASRYPRLFPGHSLDVEDQDSKRAKDWRSKEWDRRHSDGSDSTSPSTRP